MIWDALKQKLAVRGPLGFAADAAELAIASAVVVVAAAGAAAIELITWPQTQRQQAEATSCRNAEEAES